MKKIILLSILAISFVNLNGQGRVRWGEFHKKSGSFSGYNIIGHDAKYYYLNMRPKREGATLLKYSFTHRLISETPIQLQYEGNDLEPTQFIKTKSKTFAYMSNYDRKAKENNIFVAEFDKGIFGEVKRVFSHAYDEKLAYFFSPFGTDRFDNDLTGNFISKDSSHVAYVNTYSYENEDAADKMTIVVFDENMDIAWQKEQEFPYDDKSFDVVQILVSDQGEIFLSAQADKDEKSKRGTMKFNFSVFRITEKEMKQIDIELSPDKEVADAGLFLSNGTGDTYLGGFYSEKEEKGLHGVFMTTIAADMGSSTSKTNTFSAEFLEGITSKKDKKNKRLSKQFEIKNFITFEDGTFSFIAEKNYTNSIQSTSGNSYYYKYHSDEIIIPRFSKDGELLNIEKIDKKFDSLSSAECSYSFISYNGETYLIYNNKKSQKEKKSVKSKEMKKGSQYTDLCIIGVDGKIRKEKTIFTEGVTDSFYRTDLSFPADNKIILGTTKKKKYKFGTLRLTSTK